MVAPGAVWYVARMLRNAASRLAFLAVLCGLALCAGPARAAADGEWTALPDGTRTVVLVTGSDLGYVEPKHCQGRLGGGAYRPVFEEWFTRTHPGLDHFWVATGNLARVEDDGIAQPLDRVYTSLSRVPYRAVGIGRWDLGERGARLADMARTVPFPLLSANVRVHETGLRLLEPTAEIPVTGGVLGVIGVTAHDAQRIWSVAPDGSVISEPPLADVQEAIAALRPRVKTLALLSSLDYEDLRTLLGKLQGVDVVLASSGAYARLEPEMMAGVPVLWVGSEGHLLGRMALGGDGAVVGLDAVRVTGAFPVDPVTAKLKATAAPSR